MPHNKRTIVPCVLSAIFLMLSALTAMATTSETVLYSFPGSGSGSNPYANLVADTTGDLYGTTGGGGSSANCNLGSGCGTIFELTQQSGVWTETVLYSFQGTPVGDGASPQAGLVLKAGALYGTTASGGKFGHGIVFELAPPAKAGGAWTETVLYSFAGGTDGSSSASGVIFDGTSLCGTTPLGGSSNFGIVFELTPPKKKGGAWTESILYNFTGRSDGGKPYGSLLLYAKSLYGTTLDGGTASQGEVFKLTPPAVAGGPWTQGVLYSFTGGKDGGKPYANVILGKAGVLYGTTGLGGSSGYGTVFELIPGKNGAPWTESALYSFSGGPDGAYARYGVVLDTKGNLYGTTGVGTTNSGVVYELTPPAKKGGAWTESVLWTFSGGSDGGDTTAGLLLSGGMLYGTTSLGGQYSDGAVFSVVP
jgi:uncharacterized repeat protein (TIGR03803 family)